MRTFYHNFVLIQTHGLRPGPGAQPGGAFAPPEDFKTLHSNFDKCRNFRKTKIKFSYSNHLRKVLFEIFFVLLVNYLLTRFILRQAI